ncbi:hypothetical protein DE146DRAFT_463799 [Phaeosphaeria sp. MPI-PUGE-AT-0046c]|nr:hypothetical protein DE146DRAFT_463799 [Phaeosphaeria sp. MPI-PUGE-AT-0046c]
METGHIADSATPTPNKRPNAAGRNCTQTFVNEERYFATKPFNLPDSLKHDAPAESSTKLNIEKYCIDVVSSYWKKEDKYRCRTASPEKRCQTHEHVAPWTPKLYYYVTSEPRPGNPECHWTHFYAETFSHDEFLEAVQKSFSVPVQIFQEIAGKLSEFMQGDDLDQTVHFTSGKVPTTVRQYEVVFLKLPYYRLKDGSHCPSSTPPNVPTNSQTTSKNASHTAQDEPMESKHGCENQSSAVPNDQTKIKGGDTRRIIKHRRRDKSPREDSNSQQAHDFELSTVLCLVLNDRQLVTYSDKNFDIKTYQDRWFHDKSRKKPQASSVRIHDTHPYRQYVLREKPQSFAQLWASIRPRFSFFRGNANTTLYERGALKHITQSIWEKIVQFEGTITLCMRDGSGEHREDNELVPQVAHNSSTDESREWSLDQHSNWSYDAVHGELHEEIWLVLRHDACNDRSSKDVPPPTNSIKNSAVKLTDIGKDPHDKNLHLFTCFQKDKVKKSKVVLSSIVEDLTRVLDDRNDLPSIQQDYPTVANRTDGGFRDHGRAIENFFWAPASCLCCSNHDEKTLQALHSDKYRLLYNNAWKHVIAAMEKERSPYLFVNGPWYGAAQEIGLIAFHMSWMRSALYGSSAHSFKRLPGNFYHCWLNIVQGFTLLAKSTERDTESLALAQEAWAYIYKAKQEFAKGDQALVQATARVEKEEACTAFGILTSLIWNLVQLPATLDKESNQTLVEASRETVTDLDNGPRYAESNGVSVVYSLNQAKIEMGGFRNTSHRQRKIVSSVLRILEDKAGTNWYERWELERNPAYRTLEDAQSILDLDITEYAEIIQAATAHVDKSTQRAQQATLKQQKTVYILTWITAFFLPLTAVAGIFGMNFFTDENLDTELGQGLYWAAALPVTAVVVVVGILFSSRRVEHEFDTRREHVRKRSTALMEGVKVKIRSWRVTRALERQWTSEKKRSRKGSSSLA